MAYTLVPTELIVDGAVTSAKLDTNISISGTLGVTGELTLSTHMNMGDNDKIKIGTGGDLEIYHDGSNSYISNSTGNIYLADTNGSVHIQAKLNEDSLVAEADGAVTLYHDNSPKLATSSAGVTVTGTLAATLSTAAQPNITSVGTLTGFTSTGIDDNATTTAITIDSSEDINLTNHFNTGNNKYVNILDADGDVSGRLRNVSGGSNSLTIEADPNNSAASTFLSFKLDADEKLRISSSGNVTINSSGTIPTGVLLGRQLVVGSSTGSEIIAFREDTSVAVGDKVGAFLIGNSDTDGVEDHFVGMWGKVSSTNGTQDLHFAAGRSGYEGDSPQMTLDNDGNVGIGTGTIANESDHKKLKISGASGTGAGIIEFADGSNNIDGAIFSDDGNLFIVADRDNTTADSSIRFRVDGSSEKMRIDSGGNVTKPLQCNFLARRNGDQAGYNASGAYGDGVRYNSEIYDIGGDFDVTTGIFTAPVDGTYLIQGSVYSNTTGTNWSQAWLAINGARADYTDMVTADGNTFISTTHLVKLSAGDEVRYHPYYSGSTSVTILANANHTWFKGYLLG